MECVLLENCWYLFQNFPYALSNIIEENVYDLLGSLL